MADISNRDELERRLARELGRLQQSQLARLLEHLGDPPRMDNVPAMFWDEVGKELARVIAPFLERVYLEQARELLASLPIGIDWALINQAAVSWANSYTFELVGGINNTSRQALQQAVSAYFERGQTIGELEQAISGLFGPIRAEAIAVTEITRAASEGEVSIGESLARLGIQMIATWHTNNDELVCFPRWTLVLTKQGEIPIQNIMPGDCVMTRQGWHEVIATSKREYTGAMRKIKVNNNWLTATINHPVYHSEKGWLEIGKLVMGDHIDTLDNQIGKISSVVDFVLGNSDYPPSVCSKIARFAFIPFGVAVPISSINFYSNSQVSKQKINCITSHTRFLDVSDTQSVQSMTSAFLDRSFPSRFTVAGQRTELSIKIAWQNAKRLATCLAINKYRRATTFFRTEMTIESFLSYIDFATSLAGCISRFCQSARAATYRIAICDAGEHLKWLSALQTNFRNLLLRIRLLPAFARAIFSSLFSETRRKIECAITLNAVNRLARTLTHGWMKLHFFIGARHSSQLLTNIEIFYHKLSAKPIEVYDLEVDDAHEFYANGILVHNCPICKPLNGREADGYEGDRRPYWIHPESGNRYGPPPSAHPRDRCWIGWSLPKVRRG